MSMIRQMARDLITISRPDGTQVAANVRAGVQSKTIFFWDTRIPIEPGYIISRTLPSGVLEEFVVDEPGYTQGTGRAIPPHYQIKFHRKGAESDKRSGVTYNVTGNNARINIGSYDASHNIVFHSGPPEELFAAIRAAIESAIPDTERKAILDAVEGMEVELDKASFVDRYKSFMEVIATHVTVFAPFIPALTSLLPHAK